MKSLRALILCLCLAPVGAVARDDRLIIEPGIFGQYDTPEYELMLARVLLPSRYRLLQMVVVPSFSPEESVYIEEAKGSDPPFRVVSIRMKKPLWGELMRALEAHRQSNGTVSLGSVAQRAALEKITPAVERAVAPLSAGAVERLRALWRAALLDARLRPESGEMGLDGTTYRFADWTQGVGYRTAEAWSPPHGSRLDALVEVGQRLAAYAAAASPGRRATIERDLVRKADALLNRF